jgi:hypothetical protein
MSLITKGNCLYYSRSVRWNGRVTSLYLGSGLLAKLAAQEFEDLRAEDRADRQRRHEQHLADQAAERPLIELSQATTALVRLVMQAVGYRLHHRQWRRPSMSKQQPRELSDILPVLLGRAAAGDLAVVPALRNFLDRFAAGESTGGVGFRVLLEALGGDPAARAQEALIGWAVGQDLAAGEALRRRIAQVRAELAGPDASPLERLLAENLALAWADAHLAAERAYRAAALTLTEADRIERRRDRAQRRLIAAAKALDLIRRVMPAVEVRVEQHVTVEPPPVPAEHPAGRGNQVGVLAARAGGN